MGAAVTMQSLPVRAYVSTTPQRPWETWPLDAASRERLNAVVWSLHPATPATAPDARLTRRERTARALAAARVLAVALVATAAAAAGSWVGSLP